MLLLTQLLLPKINIFYLDAACDSRGFTANLLRLSLLAVEKHLFVQSETIYLNLHAHAAFLLRRLKSSQSKKKKSTIH